MRAREAKAIERARAAILDKENKGDRVTAAPFRVSIESNASLDRPRDVERRFKLGDHSSSSDARLD